MLGILDAIQIEEVLSNNFVGRIACHANGKTYVVPISYAYDGESICGHTYEGMKISMMRENPAVCFQVPKMENRGNWKSVVSWGLMKNLLMKREDMRLRVY